MFNKKLIVTMVSLILLSGCTINRVKSVSDIKVGVDKNIVFMGYDFTIPDVRIRSIYIKCSYKNTRNEMKRNICFHISTGGGKTTYKGVQTIKLKFGEYSIKGITYEIITGKETTTSSKGYVTTRYITKQIAIMKGDNITFSVSKSTSPYLGRFYIEVNQKNIEKYFEKNKNPGKLKLTTFSRNLNFKVVQKYPEDILNEKDILIKALDLHINSPIDRHDVNKPYKKNINCIDDEELFRYKSKCKVNVIKNIPQGIISKEYSFSLSSQKY